MFLRFILFMLLAIFVLDGCAGKETSVAGSSATRQYNLHTNVLSW